MAENKVLKEKLGKKQIFLNDDQRRWLAVKGKVLGRKRLAKIGCIFTPETILRWPRGTDRGPVKADKFKSEPHTIGFGNVAEVPKDTDMFFDDLFPWKAKVYRYVRRCFGDLISIVQSTV